MTGRSWKGMVVDNLIRSHELGKYKQSGNEEDFMEKLTEYLQSDQKILKSHTYPFILAYIYYNKSSK